MPNTGIPMLKNIAAVAVTAAMTLWLVAFTPARAADPATPDDTARFLAGMPPSAQSALTPLTREAAWQRHARFFDTAFGQLEQRQISKVKAWSAANVPTTRPTMFYMFSGPDFLYADALYPNASTYVLSALEPVGAVPDLTRVGYLGSELGEVEHSMSSILNLSFFITKHMKTDLHAGKISGTLPVLYVFLARSGKTIREVSLITLDDSGAVHPEGESAGKNPAHGVRIKFAAGDGAEKTLYYFTTDLSNSGVKASGFLKFCATLAPGSSLIKSASYLLHAGNFSVVRDFLLNNSATIIQDDSGVPLANYDAKKWKFLPFGRYEGPIELFPGRYQSKYAELFQHSQPLDFGIGYRWRSRESNLLLSVRQDQAGSGALEARSVTPDESVKPGSKHARRPRASDQVERPRTLFFWR
jgi:hypothetical protein